MTIQQAVLDDDIATAPPRKFTILNAMILVAVTAIGLALNKSSARDFFIYNSAFETRRGPVFPLLNWALWNFLPHLVLWSLAVAAIGLVRPPRSFREKVRQPGVAACWAAFLTILFHASWYIPFRMHHFPSNVLTAALLLQTFEEGAFAVGGAWLVLAVGGLWQPRQDWVDRVGRALGLSWIVAAFYSNFRNLFW